MDYTAGDVLLAVLLFVVAGLCEIGGGWLVWKWRREDGHWGFLLLGSLILIAYGIIATFQKQEFGRTYAAYGGFFILLALLWGWIIDDQVPDNWDWIGASIAIVGACIIMFFPRTSISV